MNSQGTNRKHNKLVRLNLKVNTLLNVNDQNTSAGRQRLIEEQKYKQMTCCFLETSFRFNYIDRLKIK